jgi:hypothetical protein
MGYIRRASARNKWAARAWNSRRMKEAKERAQQPAPPLVCVGCGVSRVIPPAEGRVTTHAQHTLNTHSQHTHLPYPPRGCVVRPARRVLDRTCPQERGDTCSPMHPEVKPC